jgi:hypothetical protein
LCMFFRCSLCPPETLEFHILVCNGFYREPPSNFHFRTARQLFSLVISTYPLVHLFCHFSFQFPSYHNCRMEIPRRESKNLGRTRAKIISRTRAFWLSPFSLLYLTFCLTLRQNNIRSMCVSFSETSERSPFL